MCPYPLVIHLPDLTRVLQDLGKGVWWDRRTGFSREGFEVALGQVFHQDLRAEEVRSVTEKYHTYKRNYVKHISFNPGKENFSKCIFDLITYNFTLNCFYLFPASELAHAPLEAVYIYFDTSTYDEIEKDQKVVSFSFSSCRKIIFILILICRLQWRPN